MSKAYWHSFLKSFLSFCSSSRKQEFLLVIDYFSKKNLENISKCLIWNWHFSPIFVLLKLNILVTLFDRKLQVFKNSPKWTIFGIFDELLAIQNVNVARFARNVECDFFCDFQTLCTYSALWLVTQPQKSHKSKGYPKDRKRHILFPIFSTFEDSPKIQQQPDEI